MNKINIEAFSVIGISVRTSNENGQSAKDIGGLWNTDLDRLYTADFEVYGEKNQNPKDAEVQIWIAVK